MNFLKFIKLVRLNKQYLLSGIIVIVIFIGIITIPLFSDVDSIRIKLNDWGFLSYPLFVGFQIFQGLSIVVPLSPLTVAGSIAFGPHIGFILSWLGILISQNIAFQLSRSLGQGFFEKRIGNLDSPQIKKYLTEESPSIRNLIILFLIYFSGIVSFDLLAYSIGVTRLRRVCFLVLSSIGTIPKLILLNFIGDIIFTSNYSNWLYVLILLIIFVVILTSLVLFKKANKD